MSTWSAEDPMQMTDNDLWERYFANGSMIEQAELFEGIEEVTGYVVHQIDEHYPEDQPLIEAISQRLFEIMVNAELNQSV